MEDSLKPGSNKVCALLLWASFAVGGCTDVLTYSKESETAGMKLYSAGNYADAAGAYRNAARQNPRDFTAYYMMGNCYTQMGQYQQAIGNYRTSLDVQATTLEGKDNPAQKYKTIDALAAAIAHSDTHDTETNSVMARAQSSQSPDEYLLLAQIAADRGDPDSAIEAYDHASSLGQDNFYIAKSYGLYLLKLGQRPRAEEMLRRSYAINQKDAQVTDGLRTLGVVPGPSLKAEKDLVAPPLPKGPLPEIPWEKTPPSDVSNPSQSAPGTAAPRD